MFFDYCLAGLCRVKKPDKVPAECEDAGGERAAGSALRALGDARAAGCVWLGEGRTFFGKIGALILFWVRGAYERF